MFDGEHSYRDISIRLTSGAFRFVTGHSEKAAYKIQTQIATIGVRGTTLDILSQRGKTTVVLQDGASRVCTLTFQCIELTQPGDVAVITFAGGKYGIQKTNNPPWTFASTCGAAAEGTCLAGTRLQLRPAASSPEAYPPEGRRRFRLAAGQLGRSSRFDGLGHAADRRTASPRGIRFQRGLRLDDCFGRFLRLDQAANERLW